MRVTVKSLYEQHSKFILASGSPRRRELLSLCGFQFEVRVSNADESSELSETPKGLVERLSVLKARDVALSGMEDATLADWYLGADTVVSLGNEILGKPESEDHAKWMLEALSGNEHEVWGGVALYNRSRELLSVRSSVTRVRLSNLSETTIASYIASGEPMDKAGAYGIQGLASPFVESISGSYSNVVGLDLALVISMLREAEIVK